MPVNSRRAEAFRNSPWLQVGAVFLFMGLAGGLFLAIQYFVRQSRNVRMDSPPPGYFANVTDGSGIDFTYHNGEEAGHNTIFESLGGGVALIDYDGDGLLDIFVTAGGFFDGPEKKQIRGLPCKLYRNLGGFKFQDVTQQAGLDKLAGGREWFYSHGCAVADYDNDGWPDLLVTGWGRVALFHNEPVDPADPKKGRRFVDVSAAAGLDKGVTWEIGRAH